MSGDAMYEIREVNGHAELSVARRIFAEYIASIAHISGQSFAHQDTDAELNGLPGKYGPPHGAIILAFSRGDCIGCAAVRPLPEVGADACELKRMYVRPTERGRGIGAALCEGVFDAARRIGYRRICLDSDPRLDSALRLYARLGFRSVARFNDDPDEGTVYLGREL
jgi:GNAT superfamily N-acetyltransferase